MIANRILNKSAQPKFFTLKPASTLSTSKISRASMTKRNKPKVSMVNGMVRNINIGLIMTLTNAMSSAVINAVKKFLSCTPLSR